MLGDAGKGCVAVARLGNDSFAVGYGDCCDDCDASLADRTDSCSYVSLADCCDDSLTNSADCCSGELLVECRDCCYDSSTRDTDVCCYDSCDDTCDASLVDDFVSLADDYDGMWLLDTGSRASAKSSLSRVPACNAALYSSKASSPTKSWRFRRG